ncbi:MAG: hypothetical protein Aurels2KO_00140 [Aureliella sp.]
MFALLSVGLLLTIGCAPGDTNPPTFEVTGTVTYKNKPVEGATVVLVATDPSGQGAVGNTDANGVYKVGTFGEGDGAVAGSYQVKVFKYPMTAEPPNDGDDVMTEEEEEDEYGGVEEDEPEARNELPAKYEDAARSGFEVTVVDSPVTLDLDLK